MTSESGPSMRIGMATVHWDKDQCLLIFCTP